MNGRMHDSALDKPAVLDDPWELNCNFDYGSGLYSSDGAVVAGYDSEGFIPATQSLLIAEIEGLFAGGGGSTKSEPWLTVNLNRGIPPIETNFTDIDWGAITPGPFIIYPKGGSKDKYYNTYEPGHVIQFLILSPVAYYGLVAIPSLISSTTPYHSAMSWEKSANQLWYWLTGENDPENPLYFGPNKN